MVCHDSILFARPRFTPTRATQIAQMPVAVTDQSVGTRQLDRANLIESEKL
jgi:hypothetical protein